MVAPIPSRHHHLCELVDVDSQLRFEVGCLVVVDDIALSQFVQHRAYLRQQCGSSCFVGSSTQVANGVAGGLCIIVVASLTGRGLAYALQRRFVICHLFSMRVSNPLSFFMVKRINYFRF